MVLSSVAGQGVGKGAVGEVTRSAIVIKDHAAYLLGKGVGPDAQMRGANSGKVNFCSFANGIKACHRLLGVSVD